MSDSLGTLTITCIDGKFTRDTQKIGRMDPYVRFWSRGHEYKNADWRHRTQPHEDGGKHPKWNDTFSIDVKYLGDDLHYAALDDDRGKDDEIGNGSQKLSAFCIAGGIDDWFEVEHKDKSAGKIHLKATWAPRKEEHPQQNLIDEAQAQIKILAHKKHELEDEYREVGERIHEHEAQGKARLAALAGDNDDEFNGRHSAADAALAEAQAKFENDARLAEEAKEAFEQHIAQLIRQAGEARDAAIALRDRELAEARERHEAEKASIEAAKVAAHEANAHKRHEIEAEIAAQAAEDAEALKKVTDEIHAIAAKLLEINNEIAKHLQALTEL